ncbi:MAG: hypothetical protein DHS20C09_04570 [marine bacterium B5-7]|nr:MAG: hypothetical protein DHS20C09_04570 [marine bacterium B5-7]
MADQEKTYPSHLTLRITPEEWAILEREARGMSYSAYVRGRTFGMDALPRSGQSYTPSIDQKIAAQILALLGKMPHTRELYGLAEAARAGTLILPEDKFQVIAAGCADIRAIRNLAMKLQNYRKIYE